MMNNNTWIPWTPNMVDDDIAEVILNKTTVKRFKKGDVIFAEGEVSDAYYLLTKGRVEVSLHNVDGRKKTISIHEPRCFFGELIIDQQPRLTSAACLTEVTVAVLDTSLSLGSEYYDRKLYQALFLSTNYKLRTQLIQLSQQIFNNVEDRVESLLAGLCATFGQDADKFIQVDLPVTHQLIADIVGSSRVRVSQILSEYSKNEKYQVKRKYFKRAK